MMKMKLGMLVAAASTLAVSAYAAVESGLDWLESL